ncbi:hypothetical protein BD769DRAFT_1442833 [Suillus cothurnatus]|nr:hypothetical protein BD769DRAFT_1442833 [Suillus cothurnatus]
MTNEMLHWDRPFKTVRTGGFETGDIVWFPEGGLNASYNCVDHWSFKHPNNDGCLVTYAELLHEVCSIANILKALGVNKGDTISVYLPMTWQFVLACAWIDCKSHVVLTSEEGRRGGKSIATKAIVDAALKECPAIEHVLVLRRTGGQIPWVEGRDKWWHDETAKVPNYYPLFILYGVVHTTGGYLLCAALTFACMADIGWITGHTYIVYRPLANGVSTTVFESTPVYPTPSRYWQTIQKHQLTQFYSAPTAIRLLRRLGAQHVENHDLSSLRVLHSVGEPINPKAWNWYNEHVGKKQCAIVDTFWQTETGSIVVTPFPGAIETKPGSATVPFFGIESAILDPVSGKELEGNNVEGVLVIKQPWPSIARSVYNDHNRYLETYMKPYAGVFYTGDGAARDEHGCIWIQGRIDGEDLLWKMSRL